MIMKKYKSPEHHIMPGILYFDLAGATRLELATSGVTGRRYNRLNYAPKEPECNYTIFYRLSSRKIVSKYFKKGQLLCWSGYLFYEILELEYPVL